MGHRRRLFLLFLVVFLASSATALAGGQAQVSTLQTIREMVVVLYTNSIYLSKHMLICVVCLQQGTPPEGGVGSMLGSRPPSCAGRCWWCGGRRCEAVQVPVAPQLVKKGGHWLGPSSYEDRSNYKPLSWRCMCGVGVLNHP